MEVLLWLTLAPKRFRGLNLIDLDCQKVLDPKRERIRLTTAKHLAVPRPEKDHVTENGWANCTSLRRKGINVLRSI